MQGSSDDCPGAHVYGTIRLTALANREGGDATARRHLVELVLEASCDAEAEAFMDRFDRAFLRTGG